MSNGKKETGLKEMEGKGDKRQGHLRAGQGGNAETRDLKARALRPALPHPSSLPSGLLDHLLHSQHWRPSLGLTFNTFRIWGQSWSSFNFCISLNYCVTLGKFLNLSGPGFPYLCTYTAMVRLSYLEQ